MTGTMSTKIPLVDLKAQYASIKNELDSAISKILENTSFIGGLPVGEFEKSFANYTERKFCTGTSCGTSALYVALVSSGIKEGDEIITTPNTFIATTEAIKMVGAKPVFVDVEEKTGLINVERIEEKVNQKTRGIIPVHLYGNVCNMEKISEIAKRHNLIIIEDCAQAHGSEYKNKKVPFNDIGCFSFFPAKTLGAYGDAGGIVTDNEELAGKMKLFSDHGRKTKYEHISEGFNFRLDALQAAILNVKLKHLDKWIERRRELARNYNRELEKIQGIKLFEVSKDVKHSYYMYAVRVLNGKRKELQEFLAGKEIATGIHYPISLNKQPVYLKDYENDQFPVAEKLAEEVLSIPLYPELTDEQQEMIVLAIKEFFEK